MLLIKTLVSLNSTNTIPFSTPENSDIEVVPETLKLFVVSFNTKISSKQFISVHQVFLSNNPHPNCLHPKQEIFEMGKS